jgi:integrase
MCGQNDCRDDSVGTEQNPSSVSITVHGFRATFRTWVDEEMNFSNRPVEFCLAHVPGDEAGKAYSRQSMLKKRVQTMTAWAGCIKPASEVISINQRAA